MKKSIAIFSSHDEAIQAVETLKYAGVDMSTISLIGKAEVVDDKIHVKSNRSLIAAPTVAGTIIGTSLGIMTGIGLFAIPGFGVIFGAGAIVGALAGFDVGLIAGGTTTILMELGIKEDHLAYEEHIREGNFLMFIDGSEEQITQAETLIEGKHLGVARH